MKQNVITSNTMIQRNDAKFLSNSLGEEMVMMNMENGDFISLNKVGADIWKLSDQKIRVGDLIEKLLDIYEITEDQCTRETITFLENSLDQNMFFIYNGGENVADIG